MEPCSAPRTRTRCSKRCRVCTSSTARSAGLGILLLPKHLSRYLAKWIDKGVYNAIFDNVEDSLSLSRIQCWDFAGVAKDYPDLIEPLMIWLLRRIDDVVYDPRNLGVPKHVVIEEDLLEHEE